MSISEKDVGRRIASLTPEQRRLLELRMQRQAKVDPSKPRPLPRAAGPNAFPLSFAQQRLWLLERLGMGGTAYSVFQAVRLTGPLDVEVLSRCFTEIARRQESLRTRFEEAGSGPVQIVDPPRLAPIHRVDLTVLPVEEREPEALRRASEEVRVPFDPGRDELMRRILYRTGEQRHMLLIVLHHIVSDGWSMGVLLGEITALYAAFSAGLPSPLPELPVQYADFSVWQREWLSGETLAEQIGYWRQRLHGAPALLELPADRPRPAIQTTRGALLSRLLPRELAQELGALSRREGLTLFMTLLAALEILLHRYTGATDLVVGTPIANRQRTEIEQLVGFFVNTLVLRTDLRQDPSFRELGRRVREVALGAFGHQDLPFEKLVDELRPERSRSHSPLFQGMFNLLNAPLPQVKLAGLTLVPIEIEDDASKFDFTLNVQEVESGLTVRWQYNRDLFDASTVERMDGHFERLLREILKDPERRLSELPLLTAAEERQLLGWNETAAAYQAGVCLHELIEARVDETPARVAVSFEGGALTYAELDAAANRLACRLRDLGVGLEVPVGVFAERSLEMVVSLLAVLKAGGAYLPLDPEYPADRLTFMLADSRVPVVLAQERLLPRLPEHGAQVILLDGVARERGERLAGGARPENLAYVIYTSGSTGRPKGTMNTHRGIVNRLLWMQERYGLTADDRVLQKTPFSFDVSVWELFWPLLAGARLVVARPGGHQDASYLARTIVAETITTLHFVPSMLQVFLEAPGVEECRSLLRVICSGEALPLELERRFFARLDGVELHNLYGPTEAAVDVTYWQCERDGDRGVVPIGHPVANTQIHLLDVAGSPVPVGIPGELHIGGVQVCRGYLARPELTAERFVPDPFSIAPGSRLYRTGDLVRYLPDGAVDFLGRTDHQVKVRGLRIELGEIESAVAGHPGIREALVVARADGDAVGAVNLVAYITLRQKETEGLSLSELRERLARTLPEYMLPSALVVLESMPLTASGKVDRKALPAPGRTAVEREPVAPRTELERSLAGLWSELLGSLEAGSIGVEDNFFQLGGNSITGAIFINRLQKELGASVPAVTIFDAPTIARLAAHLGAEYPEAVARRWDREAAAGDPARSWTAIERRAIEPGRPQPLSFAQERLWFLEQLDPSKSTYNVPNVLRLAGPLDAALLARVLGEVVRRHAALRTTFGTVEGRPAQIVSAHFDLAFEICDLTTLPAEERAVEARRQVARGVDHPFDLARGPLLRTLLLRLGSEEHVAVLTMHHIVSDGWSMGVLVREVAALYSAFSQGLSSPLPELPVQYVDFARWQREWLRGEVLESQTAYWKERLSGVGALELPTDRPRPPEQTFAGAVLPLFFSRELRDELAALGRREEATLFMTGLAAFAVLLARYAGQEDVAVGTPSANRNRPEIEDLIGFFVNTLVVRTSAAGDPPFRELLARVREASVGAFAHQDLPFEKVVEELRPERDLSRSPLFQVMFILQNADNQTLELPGLHLEPQPFPVTAAKFELTLTIVEDPRRSLSGSLEYNTDLFDAATAARLIGHFHRLLRGIVGDPKKRLSELPLLTEAERWELLAGWNDTAVSWPRETLLHELFEQQAAARPEARAVGFGAEHLSYGELEARSNRLARHLRGLGVGPEILVGLCVERSVEMVVALLAILKAGGAYVPLDPSHPAERLGLVLEDSAVPVLVSEEGLLDRLPPHGARVVCLDREAGAIASESAEPLERVTAAESLAYVLYTSGSTGRPKGVGLPHRAVVNFLRAMAERPGLDETDVVPALTTLSFDIAGLEIYLPLAVGGRVEVLGREEAADGARLAGRLQEIGATAVQATPATWRLLIDSGWQGIPDLKVLCGGEALPRDLAAALLARRAELWNVYGPTETAIWSAAGEVSPGEGPVLLGQPIANTDFHVVDRSFGLVPVGVAGELLIGGEGLSRGYLRRQDLTAEKFVPHPFGKAGARIYRTGDLVRWRPSGELEFLGRIDTQVKVRGFRIELGEIEAALGKHPSVRQAVVGIREDGGDKRLVGYLVADEAPAVDELREFLRRSLPEYMIPSAFVTLESLPLTPSGKVDRKALPVPGEIATGEGYVAPQGPVEELLAEIWAEVLRIERVGARDNFFALGGHSLLATQVVSRVRTALGIELPLQRLFAAPTVGGLARAVEEARRASRGEESPPIARVPREGDLPLSFAQERMWFLHQLEPRSSAYNLEIGVRLEGDLDTAVLARCFSEVIRRHETLRTVFTEVDGRPAQVIHPAAEFELPVVDLPVVDLRDLGPLERESELRRRSLAESGRPFDLARGPLLRALLLRTGEREHALILVMHHIASDGWSMALLLGDLTELYAAHAAGLPPPLPELPVQYADFAAWQRSWLTGEELSRQVEYWKHRLAGVPPLLELPADRPRPAVQSFRGARHRLSLPAALARSLEALGRREGLTPFMVLIAAFQALLGRYTSQDDVAVGTPIANRTRTEIERLIGFFANTLVFRADLSDDPAFLELARRVRGSALEAYDHQDLPFEKLVDELHPERQLSYPPVFQVMFILQNAPVPEVYLPSLRMLPLELDRGQSPVDLTLMLMESAAGWTGWLEYAADLFDAATVALWAGHLEALLRGIVEGPERRVSELPLLTEAERWELLAGWNDTAVSWPRETLIHELFERQATVKPAVWAVGFGAERLSYGELEARSNRLARHLRGLGVGPEVLVGLCVERSVEMVVALLAILKAGGAYAPLDPSHPAERLGLVLEDSAVPVLVGEEGLLDKLPPHGARVVCLDREAGAIASESAEPLERVTAAESLAYVLYTSGSTGRPKGVGLPHRAVVNFLRAMAERPGLDETDVVPALTTLSFDIAGLEIYLPLSVGARVEVLGREETADGARLAGRLQEIGATAVQATPATWRLLIDAGWQGIPGLKVLCGGEALPRDLAAALLARRAELWNVYGPTETAIWSAAGEVSPGEGPVLLGRPVANTDFHVVDRGFGLVPVGVAGELLIGGEGLSRGYLHRQDLTAERFVPHPFGAAGLRIYRTGDLVRWRSSGELEFLGRIDTQVKVRGFRIELGEIEAALGRHPAIRQAVVVVREEGGDKRLVGYLVADEAPGVEELRELLRRSLPEYMIPAAFVTLESLPLTPSGKVDRKSLPAPEAGLPEEGYVAPRGPVEELLAGIWAEVLRAGRVGSRDNFFALGGHSLLATQVVSRVRMALGVELPLQKLFETPSVAGLAHAVEAARRDQEGWSLPPLVRVPRGDSFPLSFSQERMWFLNQLDPGTSAYNLSRAIRLRGRLDLTVLDRCLTELIRRHETLRTCFAVVDGRPVQVIQPPAPARVEVVDLSPLPAALREAESRRRATEETSRPFDLSRDLLIRATLLRLTGEENALLLTLHHVASDGWSMAILFQEIAALYQAFAAGEGSPLPELPVQYADFSTWQRRALSGEALEAELAYWRGKLAGNPPPLLIPADRRRSAVQSFQVGVASVLLPAGLAAELRALSRRQSASLYMTLLAAWKALLARVTGEDDVLLGAPIANRNRAEVEGLIGFFLNTLILRTDLSGDPGFGELLGRVRETCLGAFAHQDLPLEQVLQSSHAERDARRSSPFQVMFLLQNFPVREIEVPGLNLSVLESDEQIENLGTAIFEAGLTLVEQEDGILASITYNALLFDEATILTLLDRYQRLLAGAAADPSRPIGDLELMSPEERRELMAWSGEAGPAPAQPVHRLFEQRAERAPEAVAVVAGDRRLTYAELNRAANRLAHHLRDLGVGPETVAGIAVERSPEMVISLLAVLKTGGAYVPLDPTYPVERLSYILRDSAATVLIASARALSGLPGLAAAGPRTVRLDADAARIAERSAENPGTAVDPENLAYLIYTSGSTGRPKGVMVRHGGLANYVEAFRDEHRLGAGDRVLQFASISFDTSAEEIYPALASGAALVLRDDAMLGSTPEFIRSCEASEVSVLDLPTAFWHELVVRLEAEPASLPARLRLVILGGERALPERLSAWYARGHRQTKLVNTYGPTECTIVATRAELTAGLAAAAVAAGEVPIGRPVRNLRACVMDRRLRLVPPGVPGELHLGGAGLARGYAGRPDLTAERFVPDPWSPEPGGRLYRTGDLVRLLPSGDLEFLGRTDDQVKIRGFRVELREIEATLGEHPEVVEAVVVAREETPGDRRLAAYLVARGPGKPLELAELRSVLKQRLPDYMIPASFTVLDRLPLTPSGKVDRRALPAPDRARRELERDFVAPRTDSETTIAAIWSEVLGLDRVGVTENFFELGGHSLLLPQVVHRLRAAFQVEVPLRALFDEPTVEGLAITLEEILIEEIERQLGEEEAVVE